MRALSNFLAALFTLLFLQCNNEPKRSATPAHDSVYVDSNAHAGVEIIRADSNAVVIDTDRSTVDSASKGKIPENNHNDTAAYPVHASHQQQQQHQITYPAQIERPKSAVLGYSYFSDMTWKEVKNINAFISPQNSKSKILDTLKKIVQSQAAPQSNDSSIVKLDVQNVSFYKFLTIKLVDPAGTFKITAIHENARQEIDTLDSNRWRWTVQPVGNDETATLIMKVIGEKPAGAITKLNDINIPIVIHLKSSWMRNTWLFLQENPEYLLTAILIPVIAYFGKKLFDKLFKTT